MDIRWPPQIKKAVWELTDRRLTDPTAENIQAPGAARGKTSEILENIHNNYVYYIIGKTKINNDEGIVCNTDRFHLNDV